MLKAMGMPATFWGEAATTAVHILNRSFTRSLEGITLHEAWCRAKPNVHYFRVFGCVAYAKETKPGLKKLEDRSRAMVMLGYEPGTKAYRLFDPIKKRVHVTRDVVFDEGKAWDWGEHGGSAIVVDDWLLPQPPPEAGESN